MSFILKRLPQISKVSIIDVTRKLVPATISALKSRCRARLFRNDVAVSLLGDTKKLHLRTRRAIYIVTQGKRGPERIFTKDLRASRHRWEKLLRRRDRASSTARGNRTKLALSPVCQPPCSSPPGPSHLSRPAYPRAQMVAQLQARFRAKMRVRMQRRKEVYQNVRNMFAGHKTPGPTNDIESVALEVPMEDVQPAPLVYAAHPRWPTTPTMSWFCRNLSQAHSVQPVLLPLRPPLPPIELVPLVEPMPPPRRVAAAQPVRPERQAKPVFWGCCAGSPRDCTTPASTTAMTPRGPRRTWKPVIRDRILPLTPLPVTPIKSRRFGTALFNSSQ